MDSKYALCFLLILLSSTFFVTTRAVQPYEQANQSKTPGINAGLVSGVPSDKGYHAMALTLNTILDAVILPTLNINPNTTLTLFCPQDKAFFNPKYPQPPLTLEYHVVEDFFDPAFQTLRYPEYDVTNLREDSSQGFFGWPDAAGIISWFLFLALLAGFITRSRISCN